MNTITKPRIIQARVTEALDDAIRQAAAINRVAMPDFVRFVLAKAAYSEHGLFGPPPDPPEDDK